MDSEALGSLMTVVLFIAFIGIVLWACSERMRRDFDEAARLPFAEEDAPADNGEARP